MSDDYVMHTFRHAGISVKAGDWKDHEIEDCLRLMKGWQHPNVPADVAAFRARAAELREQGMTCFPPCANVDEQGQCKGHEEKRVRWEKASQRHGEDKDG